MGRSHGKGTGGARRAARYYNLRLSRDGRRVASDLSDPTTNNGDIWIFDLARNVSSRLTYVLLDESLPQWAPDDGRILYLKRRAFSDLYQKAVTGTASEELLFESDAGKGPTD